MKNDIPSSKLHYLKRIVPSRRATRKNFKCLHVILKAWIPIAAGLVAIAASLWGLASPISKYLDERNRAYEINLSAQMVEKIKDLSDSNAAVAENAIMILSSYEMDAVPYLLYKLEKISLEEKKQFSLIVRSFILIGNKKEVDKVILINQVLETANSFIFNKLNDDFENTDVDANEIENDKLSILNYIKILGYIGSGNKEGVKIFFEQIKERLKLKPKLSEFDNSILDTIKDSEKRLFSIFNTNQQHAKLFF